MSTPNDELEFYRELHESPGRLVDIDGKVLTLQRNGPTHVNMTEGGHVRLMCGINGATDPFSGDVVRDWQKRAIRSSCEIVSIEEFVAGDRVCRNCLPKIESEYDIERKVMAVPTTSNPAKGFK